MVEYIKNEGFGFVEFRDKQTYGLSFKITVIPDHDIGEIMALPFDVNISTMELVTKINERGTDKRFYNEPRCYNVFIVGGTYDRVKIIKNLPYDAVSDAIDMLADRIDDDRDLRQMVVTLICRNNR